MKSLYFATAVVFIAGCASSTYNYVPPETVPSMQTAKIIERPKDDVWASSVPALSKDFFVINNMDKASGLINVSYSGDPSKFVDCGKIYSSFKNARGEETHDFNGSDANSVYVQFKYPLIVRIQRHMNLEGRINIVFETLAPNRTKVTVNSRYVLTRTNEYFGSNGAHDSNSSTGAFSSGHKGSLPTGDSNLDCIPTGALEHQVLDLIN